ncbi:hypothetical protein CRM22_002062 [Opisthorchis felineus]|uniref:Uncharacterized protein n=1 Tax=Opisthorchis felineus TaxID=147828 RepID=A0A4S2M7S2_OPIFE|nr:hypothetical protein CRM22_002062 [Opisthorchis felineus]
MSKACTHNGNKPPYLKSQLIAIVDPRVLRALMVGGPRLEYRSHSIMADSGQINHSRLGLLCTKVKVNSLNTSADVEAILSPIITAKPNHRKIVCGLVPQGAAVKLTVTCDHFSKCVKLTFYISTESEIANLTRDAGITKINRLAMTRIGTKLITQLET